MFGISQPQQIEWIRENQPAIFEKLKQYVQEGRIELQGGMWVEADTNITGEESLARQFLYGINYYKKHFGVRVKNLWLPDVFGYSGSLPQLIKKAGLDYFMTIKISWNLLHKFPYHTFNWLGIDGTDVLVHMPPEGTYNSGVFPHSVYTVEKEYREKHLTDYALIVYGIGDGGGGPGEEHIARVERQRNLNPLPHVNFGTSHSFFELINKNKNNYPSWQGELYLENHQGTYTSQAKIKYYNRYFEHKLKTIETLLVSANKYYQYKEQLEKIWKEILLYQFHDILPGSSIRRVYEECLIRYKELDKELDLLIKDSFPQYDVTNKGSIWYNPLLYSASFIDKIDDKYIERSIEGLSTNIIDEQEYYKETTINDNVIETEIFRIQFSPTSSQILSIYDKEENREVLSKPEGNSLVVYKDFGDAWNILEHYREQTPTPLYLVSRTINRYGEIYEVQNTYTFKESQLLERIVIHNKRRIIEFHHQVDWQNSNHMLRTSFPLAVTATEAYFDIQYGELKRSRLSNTTIEQAQFEVCGHNWVDVSETGYGVSLINNGKYGYYIKGDLIDINLLRSTNYPCKDGDIGQTSYTYALYIHQGDRHNAKVDNVAMALNTHFLSFDKPVDIKEKWLQVSHANIDYSTIKAAEEGNAIVIRLYEKAGLLTQAKIRIDLDLVNVNLVNIAEEHLKEIGTTREFELVFKPYEVHTIKIQL